MSLDDAHKHAGYYSASLEDRRLQRASTHNLPLLMCEENEYT